MKRYQSVNDYITGASLWQGELQQLRDILVSTGLKEEVKWGAPCYTHNGKNVVGMSGFKSYFGLWFHQGALLKDRNKVLINAQEGKTRALRQWRMSSAAEIKPATIRNYIAEAICNIDEGREIKSHRSKPFAIPPELKQAFSDNVAAGTAFETLRPGQQREYAEYVSDAKREDTRHRRVKKILPLITAHKGLNDQYR
jgi:uncharacterized protein YdeI (YjbR/CyaY-like superfamily)